MIMNMFQKIVSIWMVNPDNIWLLVSKNTQKNLQALDSSKHKQLSTEMKIVVLLQVRKNLKFKVMNVNYFVSFLDMEKIKKLMLENFVTKEKLSIMNI